MTTKRPARHAAAAALALVLGAGAAAAQDAAPAPAPAAPGERPGSLRCFILAAGAASSVQRPNGPAEQVSAFNTIAMFHLGKLAGAGAVPAASAIEAELRAEQARPAEGRQASLQACGEELQTVLRGLGSAAP